MAVSLASLFGLALLLLLRFRASLEKQQLENEAAMDRAEEKAAFGASLAIESVLHHTKQAWEADEAARQQDALGAEASDAEGVQEGELAGLTAPRVAPGGTPEVVDLPTGGTGGDFNPKSVPVPFTFGSTLRTLGIPEDEIQRALQVCLCGCVGLHWGVLVCILALNTCSEKEGWL